MTSGFEWDEAKRSINIDKHGIDFRDAIGVFDLPHLTFPSTRGNEERKVTLGALGQAVIAVVWIGSGLDRSRRCEADHLGQKGKAT